MSWTDSTTIKKHLFDIDKLPTQYTDVELKLDAGGEGSLPHKGIVSGSEKIKQILSMTPTKQSSVTLNGETWMQLSYDNLVPNEIAVSDDDDLSTIYQLDKDYAFDPENGKVRRIAGGGISDGYSVTINYLRYAVKVKNTDYTINYETGTLSVKTDGSLEPETTILADYQVSVESGVDQLISEAITEAEDKILANLKSEYDGGSSDQGIKTGATELTLAIICRGLASRALLDGMTSAEHRSRGWRDLAEQYELAAWRTLRPFLKSPMPVKGAKKTNQSWEWS